MVKKLMPALVCAACLSGCANINSIYRPIGIGAGDVGQAVALDIKQRAIFSAPRVVAYPDGTKVSSVVICAEPSPDALSAYSASGALTGSASTGAPGATPATPAQIQTAFAAAEASASVGLRTQSIQLLRDGLFSNCISFLGGGLIPSQFYELQRRSQNFTLGLLAIEQLTGAVRAGQAALNTSAASATGSDDTEKESAALDDAKMEQNDARKALEKGKLDLASARKAVADQETKTGSAQKAVTTPPKDADAAFQQTAQETLDAEKASLASKRRDAEDQKVEVDALARASANADSKTVAAQSALSMAQSRVRSAAAGNSSIARAGGASGVIASHVSTAVLSIVQAVLKESGRGEKCNAILGDIKNFGSGDDAEAALRAACSDDQLETAARVKNLQPDTAKPADNKANAVDNVFERALKRAPVAPAPPPPPPAPK